MGQQFAAEFPLFTSELPGKNVNPMAHGESWLIFYQQLESCSFFKIFDLKNPKDQVTF